MRLRIPREYFLVFPTPSILYALLGGVGADISGGVVNGVSFALAGEVGAGDWG